MHRIYGLRFAWHWHIICARVHMNSPSRIGDWWLVLKFHMLIIVKN